MSNVAGSPETFAVSQTCIRKLRQLLTSIVLIAMQSGWMDMGSTVCIPWSNTYWAPTKRQAPYWALGMKKWVRQHPCLQGTQSLVRETSSKSSLWYGGTTPWPSQVQNAVATQLWAEHCGRFVLKEAESSQGRLLEAWLEMETSTTVLDLYSSIIYPSFIHSTNMSLIFFFWGFLEDSL